MHGSTWDSWLNLFNQNGYQAVTPGWPGDSASARESRQNSGTSLAASRAAAPCPGSGGWAPPVVSCGGQLAGSG
jgi:hypothetical protein